MKQATKEKKVINLSEIQAKVIPVFVDFDVKKAHLFGSYARGEATRESDIDILIQFNGEKSLLDLIGLGQTLRRVLGKSVDVTTKGGLHPLIKKNVQNDLVSIFGKK